MKKKYRILKIEIERHWIILGVITAIIGFSYVGEVYADQINCNTKNPYLNCNLRGTIDISMIKNNSTWVQTSGFGSHWYTDIQGHFVPQPEFRSGYYHAVCNGVNSTCYWHIDKYPATNDIPFGTVLHVADYLTLVTPLSSERGWQLILWGIGIAMTTLVIEGFFRVVDRLVK